MTRVLKKSSKKRAACVSRKRPATVKQLVQTQKELEDRLRFEVLVTEISTQLISIPADHIDEKIKAAQKKICDLLGIDSCALWQFSSDRSGNIVMSHWYASPAYNLGNPENLSAKESFPWCLEQVRDKRLIILSRVKDAPLAAARDLVRLRTNYKKEQVYLYRSSFSPEQARTMFLSMIEATNAMRDHPQFYNTLTHSCTNTLGNHIIATKIAAIPFWKRRFLTGDVDRRSYDNGLFVTFGLPFAALRQKANIDSRAQAADQDPRFSEQIRTHLHE